MKVSVSLPDEDIAFLDAYARQRGIESRSAVVQKAVRLLRSSELGDAYADAWRTWEAGGEADLWKSVDSELSD